MKKLKTVILILFACLSVIKSNENCFSHEDLKLLEKTLHESSEYMTKEAKEEDIVICIGATRAGKSTLINYLIGNELKAEKVNRFQPITISKVNSRSLGPEIGLGSTSKTTIPTRWTSKNLPEMTIWDAPGFDDNRGPVQDITNAFYLYQLLQKVKSLKIVLAVDINDILHDNIKPFLSVLAAVENLLGDKMRDYFTIISVIFTKVPKLQDGIEVDIDFINAKLEYQFLSSNDMQLSEISKEFVEFLIKNNNHIAFFKRPEIGLVTSAIDVNIFQVIKIPNRIDKNSLNEISPSISDHSRICLYQIRETLYSTKAFQDLQNNYIAGIDGAIKYLNDVDDNINSEYSIMRVRTKLTEMERKLHSAAFYAKSFPEKMDILQTVDPTYFRKFEELNLIEKYKLMLFVDKLLDLKESIYWDVAVQGFLKSYLLKVKEGTNLAQANLNSIARKKYEIQILEERRRQQAKLDELNRRIEEQRREQNKGFWRRLGDFLSG